MLEFPVCSQEKNLGGLGIFKTDGLKMFFYFLFKSRINASHQGRLGLILNRQRHAFARCNLGRNRNKHPFYIRDPSETFGPDGHVQKSSMPSQSRLSWTREITKDGI